jgi:hypothetical protein
VIPDDRIAAAAAAPFHRSPPVLADPSLPHQIVLRMDVGGIIVTCNCLRMREPGGRGWCWRPLDTRSRWEAQEPIKLWKAHMAGVTDG